MLKQNTAITARRCSTAITLVLRRPNTHLLHAISFLLDNVTPRSSSRLNGITPRSSLRIDSVDASSQLLVECVDSATQLSRTSENRSENGEHTGDERHAREYGLKTHLDHPSILTRTTDTTHLFRRIVPC